MRMNCLIRAMLLSVLLSAPVFAQFATTPEAIKKISEPAGSATFAPLDDWKAAVLAGDKSALTSQL